MLLGFFVSLKRYWVGYHLGHRLVCKCLHCSPSSVVARLVANRALPAGYRDQVTALVTKLALIGEVASISINHCSVYDEMSLSPPSKRVDVYGSAGTIGTEETSDFVPATSTSEPELTNFMDRGREPDENVEMHMVRPLSSLLF
jgi:hypothetical protein